MGLVKKGSTAVAGTEVIAQPEIKKPESGVDAAVARLQQPIIKVEPKQAATIQDTKAYKPRDFDKEARGKTRCVQFEAALMSPAIAGLPFKTLDEYLELVRKAADAGVKYSFEE